MKKIFKMMALALLSGCSSVNSYLHEPKSVGERNASYSYIPLDPLPVVSVAGQSCGPNYGNDVSELINKLGDDSKFKLKNLLDSLPDNAVRMAIKQISGNANISLGASSVGMEGSRYQVILDYINVDSTNIRFSIKKSGDAALEVIRIPDNLELQSPLQSKFLSERDKSAVDTGNTVIPVYVGVGLRLTADIKVIKGNVNLASLGAIAASVEAGNASGSLVVQTIGVTGKQVSVSLPMPSELNQTTVQTAILSLGSIKAIIYDEKSSIVTPRVTGIYLPVPNASEELVNKIVSELARYPIPWSRACFFDNGQKKV
jgi:hypothetical protein